MLLHLLTSQAKLFCFCSIRAQAVSSEDFLKARLPLTLLYSFWSKDTFALTTLRWADSKGPLHALHLCCCCGHLHTSPLFNYMLENCAFSTINNVFKTLTMWKWEIADRAKIKTSFITTFFLEPRTRSKLNNSATLRDASETGSGRNIPFF